MMVFLLLFTGLVVALALAYWRWENSSYVRTLDLIPGPKKTPVIGNATDVPLKQREEILATFQKKWVQRFGHIYRVWFGFQGFVGISSPALMEKLLTSQQLINKDASYDTYLKPWLGEGLLVAKGDKWKKHRRLLTPAFHFQILDNFVEVFNRNSDILCQQFTNFQEEVDVLPYLKRCTLDIICESAMGIQINAQTENSEYLRGVERMGRIVFESFFALNGPQLLPSWIYYNFTARGREHKLLLDFMHRFTEKVVRDRKRELEQQPKQPDRTEDDDFGLKKRKAFLDLLLLAVKDGADLTDTDIREEVDTFMFEGHDTTAAALVWFLYCMGTNPVQQELVRDELKQVFGDSDRPCTVEDAANLKYLECCIKETLRLYPSVAVILRHIDQDFELGGYTIPAGTSVSLLIYALLRNEESFPDPLVFKPERFQADQIMGRHPFAYVPFSAGPRNCIGQRFAMLEEKVVLSTLLRRFQFTYDMVKHGPAKPFLDLVLKPINGMPLTVTPC